MKIRQGLRKDIPEVAGYLKEMWLMHGKEEPRFVSEKKMGSYNVARIERYLKDCFNGSKRSYLLVAEENGEMVGFLKVNITKIQSFFVQNSVLYLDDTYVKEKYRGNGIAKALEAEAEKIAKKRKIKWLKARIYEFNKPAQNMAKSIGLRPLYSEYFKILDKTDLKK